MAEIDIERRGRRFGWPWLVALAVLLLVVGTTWYLALGPGAEDGFPDLDLDRVPAAPPESPVPGTSPGTPDVPESPAGPPIVP
jgi:hypothetical protein